MDQGNQGQVAYDFGDDWQHEVLFGGCLRAGRSERYPLCVEGEPVSKATTWLRVSYWTGAVADGVMVVAMLYPPMLRSLLGVSGTEVDVETRCALAMGASLMAGWTVLLLWADRKPLERSGVLILTVFPVIVGLALATAYTGHGSATSHSAERYPSGCFSCF